MNLNYPVVKKKITLLIITGREDVEKVEGQFLAFYCQGPEFSQPELAACWHTFKHAFKAFILHSHPIYRPILSVCNTEAYHVENKAKLILKGIVFGADCR